MKRCSECRRDYYDDSLLYCLDDGTALLEGPAPADEPATAILQSTEADDLASRFRGQKKLFIATAALLAIIAVAAFFGYRYFKADANKQIDSIAVLPFFNDSGSQDVEYLSDGLTEELIVVLSRLPNLNVRPRSSVFRLKGKDVDPQGISRDLGVQAVLNGRVGQRGEDVSLFVELIDVSLDRVVWSQRYDRKMADLAALHVEVARDVSGNLRRKLSEADTRNLTRSYTDNAEAYALYLKGRYYWDKRNEDGYKIAIDAYNRAIELDPKYALAFAGIADCYLFRAAILPRRESMQKAREYALKALELDDSLSESHTTLAFVRANYDLDMAAAEIGFKRAIELNQSNAIAHQFYGTILVATERTDEGLAELRRAVDLEPFSAATNWSLGVGLANAGLYDESVAQQQRTLQLQPGYALAEGSITSSLILQGKYDDALARIQTQLQLNRTNESVLTNLAIVYAKTGRQSEARKIVAELAKESKEPVGNRSYGIGRIHAAIGDNAGAIRWLQKAFDERAFPMMFLRVDRFFEGLRDDPAFQDVLRRLDSHKDTI